MRLELPSSDFQEKMLYVKPSVVISSSITFVELTWKMLVEAYQKSRLSIQLKLVSESCSNKDM